MFPIGTEEPKPRRRFHFLTLILIAINAVTFYVEMSILSTEGEIGLESFILKYGAVPYLVLNGRNLHTLLTSMFLHAGVAHIAFNMLYLLVFGDNVEDVLGHGRYLAFYIITGLGASIAQILVDPLSRIPAVGASGAIAGVLAGYLLLFPRGNVRAFIFIGPFIRVGRVPAVLFIGFWFVTQLFNGVASLGVETSATGGVAYWAHIGGFVAGIILIAFFKLFTRTQNPL